MSGNRGRQQDFLLPTAAASFDDDLSLQIEAFLTHTPTSRGRNGVERTKAGFDGPEG